MRLGQPSVVAPEHEARDARRVMFRRGLLVAALLLLIHVGFTASIRGYVIPELRADTHWQFGLLVNSDSQFFFEEALAFRDEFARSGARAFAAHTAEHLPHARVFGLLLWATGSSRPYVLLPLNAAAYLLTAWLLFALARAGGTAPRAAVVIAVVLCASPLMLLLYSELLREPFIVPAILAFTLGLEGLTRPRATCETASWRALAGYAVLMVVGFVAACTVRTYLLYPLFGMAVLSALLVALVLPALKHPLRIPRRAATVLTVVLAGLLFSYVIPTQARVRHMRETIVDASSEHGQLWRLRALERRRLALEGKIAWTREDALLISGPCTLEWKKTPWLPSAIEERLKAVSCERQDFQRSCDVELLDVSADRNCDEAVLESAGAVIRHAPAAAWFGLFTPFPNMWTTSFGSGGTGLRRAGYVIDGVLAYALLIGLVPLTVYARRDRPHLLILAAAIAAVIALYALAVPTQFILARLRVGLYLPLLVLGAIGWQSLRSWRRRQ